MRLVSLQKEAGLHAPLPEFAGVLQAPPIPLADFAATARVIAGLEAVVTVDTAIAHLAGAMGRPTFLLLSHAAEWRWLMGRAESPWYPSMRLVRQPAPGDWPAAVAMVAAGLRGVV
jgi:ADP-heptose:LPS heptosyltransferase